MHEQRDFRRSSEIKASDEIHRKKILKAINTYTSVVKARKSEQFSDWQNARQKAEEIKYFVLQNLPELLLSFEKKMTARGVHVLWASDDAEARRHFLKITKNHGAGSIVKSKSMTTEEILFNETCEENGLEVLESDLGEMIVQLAGEKPYHIVTPAMHKNRQEIARLFQEKLGAEYTEDARELTMIARHHLRESYTRADIGVTGANFLIAREGAVVLTENEGNARLSMSCPPVHVVICGIEKILPRLSDLSLFLPLLATSGTGQQITCYNTIIRGPRTRNEKDGPQEMYIILLDNGRSSVYADDEFRRILSCIRCGACLNECPVYRSVGGHTYHTTYQGPVGSVLTPQLKGLPQWGHLSYASSLCAACSDVCPVGIDLHYLLLQNRLRFYAQKNTTFMWNTGLKIWAFIMSRRARLNFFNRFFRPGLFLIRPLLPRLIKKRIPPLPQKSFSTLWRENEQQG